MAHPISSYDALPRGQQLATEAIGLPREGPNPRMVSLPAAERNQFYGMPALPSPRLKKSDLSRMAQSLSSDPDDECGKPFSRALMGFQPEHLIFFALPPKPTRDFGISATLPPSPEQNRCYGMPAPRPPSPEQGRWYGMPEPRPPSPEQRFCFGLPELCPPSPEQRLCFGMQEPRPPSPEQGPCYGMPEPRSPSPEQRPCYGMPEPRPPSPDQGLFYGMPEPRPPSPEPQDFGSSSKTPREFTSLAVICILLWSIQVGFGGRARPLP